MSAGKVFQTALQQRIADEQAREQTVTADNVYHRIISGNIVRAAGNLLFHTEPAALNKKLDSILEKVSKAYTTGDINTQICILNFLVKLSIDLRSFLPHWVLLKSLDSNALAVLANKTSDVLDKLGTIVMIDVWIPTAEYSKYAATVSRKLNSG